MEFLIGKRFKLGRKIGVGGFGEVYEASDNKTKNNVAVKLENRTSGALVLQHEVRILKELEGVKGIPIPLKFGIQGDYNYLAMPYLGYSLETLHTFCNKKFTVYVKNILKKIDSCFNCNSGNPAYLGYS